MIKRFVIGTSIFGSGCAATWAYYNLVKRKEEEEESLRLPVSSFPSEMNKARDILAHGPHGLSLLVIKEGQFDCQRAHA